MSEFEKNCLTCRFGQQDDDFCYPCTKCDTSYSSWESCIWLSYWLNSFDTTSATKCFEAVNILKERLESEDEKTDTR